MNNSHGVYKKPVMARDSIVRHEMKKKQHLYTYKKNIRLFCATWNVNGHSPTMDTPLSDWLASPTMSVAPDIYIVGFQELDLSKEVFLFNDTVKQEEWLYAVMRNVYRLTTYIEIKVVRLVGIMIVVLAKSELSSYISNVSADYVGTGIMGKLGNKGGVAVSLDIHRTSFCFVNSHLAAHIDEVEKRNQDYSDICRRVRFHTVCGVKTIMDHDKIFWIGDLNYRITDLDADTVKKLIDDNNLDLLLKYDQLLQQKDCGNTLVDFHEPKIDFRPTYKYDPGTNVWDSSDKSRAPAWCDRVLYRGSDITVVHYTSHATLLLSDHKPISALFDVQVNVTDTVRYRDIYENVMKDLDRMENEALPQVCVSTNEVSFGTVAFLQSVSRSFYVINTGQVAAQCRFIEKFDDSQFCKPWLQVYPQTFFITPGDRCEISLEIKVDEKCASLLSTCKERLEDILILHLENGKDIFVAIQGDFTVSCFGASISTLVHTKCPYSTLSEKAIVDMEQGIFDSQITYAIPKELWFIIDQLRRQLPSALEELFLQSGLPSEIHSICHSLDTSLPNSIFASAHSLAEVLLLFLSSFAEPVVPAKYVQYCLNACNSITLSTKVIEELPTCHRNVFDYVIEFLKEIIAQVEDSCKSNYILSLANIFSAVLLRDSHGETKTGAVETSVRHLEYTDQMQSRRAAFIHLFLTQRSPALL